jgi:hypothetical protein
MANSAQAASAQTGPAWVQDTGGSVMDTFKRNNAALQAQQTGQPAPQTGRKKKPPAEPAKGPSQKNIDEALGKLEEHFANPEVQARINTAEDAIRELDDYAAKRGPALARGSEAQAEASKQADEILAGGKKKPKKITPAKTKFQIDQEEAAKAAGVTKPPRQRRLPKDTPAPANTGSGRGTAQTIDEINFTNPDKFKQIMRDPNFVAKYMAATTAQREAFMARHQPFIDQIKGTVTQGGGRAPVPPTPQTPTRAAETGSRGTGRASQKMDDIEFDDMSVGGYEVIDTPAPARRKPAAKKGPAPKREPKAAPDTVADTLDARATQKELNRVESEIENLQNRETTRKGVGKSLDDADKARLKELKAQQKKLQANIGKFNARVVEEEGRKPRIG